ncbi:MAG: InlB B-repeat-containing protein, partial [Acutalibacteraceae bacterium]
MREIKKSLAVLLSLLMIFSSISAGFVISAAEPALVDASIGKYTTYSYYVDGALVDTQTVAEGEKPAAIATPVKDHFRFDGWKETTQSDGSVRCDAEFTQVFFVRFMHRDGRVFMTKQGAKGDIITTSDVAFSVSAEESVTGWYTDPEHTNKVDTVTLDDSDIDLYPTVGRGYWVTYDADGGSYTYPEFYAANAKTKAPAEPTKEGYTFTGWTLDGAPYSFGDTPDGDITLKATWKANGSTHYRVVYLQENANDDGYSYVESKDMTGETGSMTAAAADKSYNGFSAPDTIEQKEIKADGSTVVEVKYKRYIYTIKFYEIEYNWWGDYYYAGDEIADLRITAKYGENVSHQWPGYKGYSAMWSTDPGGSTWQSGISAMPAKNLSFYETDQSGNYTCPYRYYLENLSGDESGESFNGSYYTLDNTIDIKFERGTIVTEEDHFDIEGFTFSGVTADGTNLTTRGLPFYYNRNSYNVIMINGSEKTEKSLQFGAKLTDAYFTPEAPADKTGYEFLGWFDNSIGYGDAIDFDQTTMGAGNMTVYACWKAPTVEVTVSDFDGNEDKTHVEYGGSIDVSALGVPDLPEGEEFLYWAIKEGDSYTQLTSATKIYGPVTIVPMTYSKVPYKVAYDVEEVSDSYTYVKNSSAVVLGYIGDNDFVGWELDGKLYYPNSTVNVSSDLELKAKYAEKQAQVSLNYDANGGDGDSAGRSFKKNTVISVDECSFTRKGYTFDGWNTEADGSGTAFAPGDAVRIIGDAKLWAQWKADEFELEYYVSYGGSETLYKTETVKYGEKLELAELPEENGYTFSDWKVEGGYTTMPEGGAKAICEKTLNEYTAKLEENGGTDVEDIKFTVESAAEALPKTERAGYSFAGWFESPDFSGDAVTEIAAGSIGDITFYAKWDKITDGSSYKVIVRKENAADDGYAETTETIRATVEDVINFTGAEYAEEGFVFDAENSVVSGIVAGDGSLTLTLSYNRTRHTVRYFVDGVCTDIHEGVKFGAATPAYSKETPGKVGYTFAGWGDVQPKVAGDADYNAEWTVNTWAVTFYEEDGETVIRTLTVDYGEKIDASGIVPAEKTGYTFSGWDIPETMPDNDLSFTASYTPNTDTQYKVETYKMNVSGSHYELVSADMKNGTTDTEAQTDAPGQEGFSLNEEKSILQGNIAGDGSLVLKIYYDRNQYTLTVDNANGDEIIQTTLYYGAWVSVSQPDRVGYIFAGWNNTVPEKMPADDVTLTALWTARTDLTGKVTYTDTNGKQ